MMNIALHRINCSFLAGTGALTAACSYEAEPLEGVSTIVQRSVFQSFGSFRADYRLTMNYEFWWRILQRCRFAQIDEPRSDFSAHALSATHMHRRASFDKDSRVRFHHRPRWMCLEYAAGYAVRRWRGEGGHV